MEQRAADIVDDFPRRHDDRLGLIQFIVDELIEHRAIFRHERGHARRVENIHGAHDAAVIPRFQDVGVAVIELATSPTTDRTRRASGSDSACAGPG